MKKRSLFTILFIVISLVGGYALTCFGYNLQVHDTLNTSQGIKNVPDEILVLFKPGAHGQDIAALNARMGATVMGSSRYSGVKRLKISPRKTVEEMAVIYRRNPNVVYAEANFIARALWAPNDPFYNSYQWHLDNVENGGIEMESAWDISRGDNSVIVAVLDTGVAYEDHDQYIALNRNKGYWVNYLQAPDLADTNFVDGYDFINNDLHPNDDAGHGTHVTGTIAQSTDNDLGVAGIAPDTTIMPVKVLDSSGLGSYTAIADGIYFATDNGARVINMSLGGDSPSITLENALAYAHARGVTIVCAAGNDGYTNAINYPAAYDAYCIAVGATRYDETVTAYSNQGASIDITAPGGDTSVDQNGDGAVDGVVQQTFDSSPTDFDYFLYQGTSMATPHISGVAALLLAQDDSRTPEDIREIIQTTAEDHGPAGWDVGYGWGIVDAAAALNYTVVDNTIPVAQLLAPTSGTENVTITVDGSGSSDGDNDPLIYRWDFGDGTTASGFTANHSYNQGGSYNIRLIVNDGHDDSLPAEADILIEEINDPPVADAGNDQSAQIGQVVTFDAIGSYDIDDGIFSYQWDFGDGYTANAIQTSHSYTTAATFDVQLTVTDYDGSSNIDHTLVDVIEVPATVALLANIELLLNEQRAGRNLFINAVASVTITDVNGPQQGVAVSGMWDGAAEVLSATTDSDGQAMFQSPTVKNPPSGTVFSFSITQTEKVGYAATPQGETIDSISY